MENPIKMDDLGVPLFLETATCIPGRLVCSSSVFVSENVTLMFSFTETYFRW